MSREKSVEQYVQISYLVPITEDKFLGDGEPHANLRWQLHADKLVEKFGGYTRASGLFEGEYKDPDNGSRVADNSIEFRVAIQAKDAKKLRVFIKNFVAPLFRQKIIYVVIMGQVELINCNRKNIKELP